MRDRSGWPRRGLDRLPVRCAGWRRPRSWWRRIRHAHVANPRTDALLDRFVVRRAHHHHVTVQRPSHGALSGTARTTLPFLFRYAWLQQQVLACDDVDHFNLEHPASNAQLRRSSLAQTLLQTRALSPRAGEVIGLLPRARPWPSASSASQNWPSVFITFPAHQPTRGELSYSEPARFASPPAAGWPSSRWERPRAPVEHRLIPVRDHNADIASLDLRRVRLGPRDLVARDLVRVGSEPARRVAHRALRTFFSATARLLLDEVRDLAVAVARLIRTEQPAPSAPRHDRRRTTTAQKIGRWEIDDSWCQRRPGWRRAPAVRRAIS